MEKFSQSMGAYVEEYYVIGQGVARPKRGAVAVAFQHTI
jgi:hypothetical protein